MTTTVQRLIDEAAASGPTPGLLRKLKVIAARTRTQELASWVDQELNGYDDVATLPAYRGPFDAILYGHFVGPMGHQMTVGIPAFNLPEDYRDTWSKVWFSQGVGELEALAESDSDPRNQLNADSVGYLNLLADKGEIQLAPMHHLIDAYKPVTRAQIRGVLDTIKTRVLDLALDLERLNPATGDADADQPESQAVAQIVQNHIYGSVSNFTVGSTGTIQLATVDTGDLTGLLSALRGAGFHADDVADLENAVGEDAQDERAPESTIGPRVDSWLHRAREGALRASGTITTGTAAGVAAELVKQYYGLG